MHWTEAVNKSQARTAVRQHSEGRLMYRNADGTGGLETWSSAQRQLAVPEFTKASGSNLEGHDDWSPAVLKVDWTLYRS